ncbi:MAG: ribosomal protein S18-alanine N-acetyltransferase [Anaerolineae bacterium]|nr:ribosomal protein S18-alanine N-acetyltransferase [Anaerolineae bacterium]
MTHEALSYTIRPMELGDIPTVVAIDQLSFPTPWPASSYAYELKHRNASFYYVLLKPEENGEPRSEQGWRRWLLSVPGLGKQERRVIGYLGLRLCSSETHISTIAVHPNWRGKGLGEFLLLTALERSWKMEFGAVTLEVRPSNQVAQRLYRKYGFRFTGVHAGYYRDGEDAWLMAVEIDQDAYRARLAELRRNLELRLSNHLPSKHDSSTTHVGQNPEGKL